MKIALYIEDGLEQIVLTPNSDLEKNLLRRFHTTERQLSIKQGGFYHCRGGWTRQNTHASDDTSTIFVFEETEKEESKKIADPYTAMFLWEIFLEIQTTRAVPPHVIDQARKRLADLTVGYTDAKHPLAREVAAAFVNDHFDFLTDLSEFPGA